MRPEAQSGVQVVLLEREQALETEVDHKAVDACVFLCSQPLQRRVQEGPAEPEAVSAVGGDDRAQSASSSDRAGQAQDENPGQETAKTPGKGPSSTEEAWQHSGVQHPFLTPQIKGLLAGKLARLDAEQGKSSAESAGPRVVSLEQDGRLYLFFESWLYAPGEPKWGRRTICSEQTLVGRVLTQLRHHRARCVLIDAFRLEATPGGEIEPLIAELVFGLERAYYPLPHYRTLQKHHGHCSPQSSLSCFLLFPWRYLQNWGQQSGQIFGWISEIKHMGKAANLVRHAMVEPPNVLTPKTFAAFVRDDCKRYPGLQYEFYSFSKLQKLGAGAFCAVASGDPQSGAGIVKVSYGGVARVGKEKESSWPYRKVAFVGKGITYDTGGVNVKPATYMRGMKNDMTGASLVYALVRLASQLQWPIEVTAYLALADNVISHSSYKPDDVVQSLSGLSIEVVHTDAEGRMVLADTLHLACQDQPDLIMDYATLTGASVSAISRRYHSVYTNRWAWHRPLVEAGHESGERVWTFPLDPDFGECLSSEVADTLQCRPQGGVDHIEAAMFLQKFIAPSIPWVHVDLSHARTEKPMGSVLSKETGAGVRFTCRFLELLKDAAMDRSPL